LGRRGVCIGTRALQQVRCLRDGREGSVKYL
jgi:hypothetical protein